MTTSVSLKQGTLTSQTVDHLTDMILRREVCPGELLPPEHDLCRRLGIGRGTLREAMKVLESKGLTERQHGIGTRVVDRGNEAISDMLRILLKRRRTSAREVLEVRRLYEVKAAALAAERRTTSDVEVISKALENMQSEGTTTAGYVNADLNFHLSVARATQNSVLTLMIEMIRPLLHEAIVLATHDGLLRLESSRPYHEKIYTAIEERRPDRAGQAMEDHLRGTAEVLLGINEVGEPIEER